MSTFNRIFRPKKQAHASLSQAFAGPLLIDHRTLESLLGEIRGRVVSMSAAECRGFLDHLAALEAGPAIEMDAGTAHIAIEGYIMGDAMDAAFLRFFGVSAIGTDEVLSMLAAACADPRAEAVVLHFDSPGGSATGVAECAAAIAECSDQKPITAYVRGMCASAAYWMASQADSITAEPSATVGSIGAFTAIADSSKLYEEAGVKVHLIASGPHKGAGTQGVPISDEQLGSLRRSIEALATMFKGAVARGRGMSAEAIEALATGEAWFAAEAKSKGLVDAVAAPSIRPRDEATDGNAAGKQAPPRQAAGGDEPDGDENRHSHPPHEAKSAATPDGDPIISAESPTGPSEGASTMPNDVKPTENAEAKTLREELAQAKAQLEEANAARKIAETFANAARQAEITAVLDKHQQAGRITPAMRTELEEASKAYLGRAEAFDKLLASFPAQVKPQASGQAPTEPWLTPKVAALPSAERQLAERRWKHLTATLKNAESIEKLVRMPDGSYKKVEKEGAAQ